MSEYKENTVGWWLSQLKEPLRSSALDGVEAMRSKDYAVNTIEDAINSGILWAHTKHGIDYWAGVYDYFIGVNRLLPGNSYNDGYNTAEECAPDNWLKPKDGGEDEAIVDSPEKPMRLNGGELPKYRAGMCLGAHIPPLPEGGCVDAPNISPEKPTNWVDQELWKWHTDMVKGGVEYADAERGKVKLVADSPAPIAFEWNDNSVIDFTTWNLKRIKLYEDRFEIENQDILDSFKRGDAPELWHKPEASIPLGGFEGFNKWVEAHGHPNLSSEELLNLNEWPKILYDETFLYPGGSPKPKDSWEVERAVVGYEEPKPIDTIEKKHELRIQNLELAKFHQGKKIETLQARVEQLEGIVGKLERQIEYINMNIPKSK